ncbi:MAG: XdhC family protein [Candidatus Puniceispirillales bacterium]
MALANDHILVTAASWSAEGHAVALALVIRTWGSSPRQNGSLMAIRDDGQIAGSVSGGCVETAVIDTGLRLIREGGAERLDFGVADETAWRVGLSCGGQIGVWVCPVSAMEDGLLAEAASRISSRQTVAIDCDLTAGRMTLAAEDDAAGANTLAEDGAFFRLEIRAKPRLLIIGGVHISQHLAPMAMDTGFSVTVIDPRTTFANAERFPGVDLISDWPQDAMASIGLDAETALVTLTHDPKIDDAALKIALPQPLFHIACLGSRRTHAARQERLREAGFSDAEISRIKGPAGLDIGAETPAEIAVSVLAELVAAWRGKGA